MIPYLSPGEAAYLSDLVAGTCTPSHWADEARAKLMVKLADLERWAIKEDAARDRLRKL